MRLDLLDYELPEEAIAKRPPEDRLAARLLVVDVRARGLADRTVADLASLIAPGSLVVLNETRVVRARLLGRKVETSGKVELLLVDALRDEKASSSAAARFRAMGRGFAPFRPGLRAAFGEGRLIAELERQRPDGLLEVRLFTPDGAPVAAAIDGLGQVPLPPYLRRPAEPSDEERYQTVYARVPGAIAAPTAGLHFTPELLGALEARGVRFARITLHVGLGTFLPVTAPDLDQHPMHAEWMDLSSDVAAEVQAARARGADVVAVGTTVVRALETAADPERDGHVRPMTGETRLLIQPGYRYRVVDALLTNFHLPRSTLLALVAAFAGRSRVLSAYGDAVRRGYRFYSYGDAMWIPRRSHPGDEVS
jgi:S-adenosylmethionine:tRNA ribosyltransferase-isomerase